MAHLQYMPGDPRLVDQLVYELKSKGIFDQFRKECIADVDTRPAYQNLRQRVESSVSTFLSRQTWKPDLNKNQLREKLRKHILDGNYLEQGVERIVDQVVNPKVASVFVPQVEDLVYNYLGIPRKKTTKAEVAEKSPEDLLPTDLEAVSPFSVKSNDGESKESDGKVQDMDIDSEEKAETNEDMSIDKVDFVEISSDSTSIDKSSIPLPTEEIKLENIPAPENSPKPAKNEVENIELPSEPTNPPKIEIKNIELPREPNLSTDIPLPDEVCLTKENHYFKAIDVPSENSNSSSSSSIRRNMSPLTPVRNFDDENSGDAQQAFENNSIENDHKEPNSFRFNIEPKDSTTDSSDVIIEKKQTEQLSYQFANQVNINTFNTPLYDDSSNSHNLQIDYESDANTNTSKTTEVKPELENSEDSKKERKDDKKIHKISSRSRDSSRHLSSKDKHSNFKDSSRQDKKSSSKDDKSKSSKERETSKDRSEKKDSYKNKSSHKSSSSSKDKDRSSSSSHKNSSKSSDDRKSSSKDKEKGSEKDKEKCSEKDKTSRDRKDSKSSSQREKDKKSSKKDKDKKKEKKDTDDHYSSSGRGNHSRRSTDRDSNDGSSSSKGSQNQNNSKSTTDSKKENKSSSSKSDNTSTSGESTSPSDKEHSGGGVSNMLQIKPIVRVDNHLETPIANPPRLPFVPDVTLKKPKFANNFEEAKRMMKMRRFLAEEQKRMNQEAALLLEFQANVRPSLSQVYSSIPGPELEFACVNHTEPDVPPIKKKNVKKSAKAEDFIKIEICDTKVLETVLEATTSELLDTNRVTIDIINDIIGVPVNEGTTEQNTDIIIETDAMEIPNIYMENHNYKNDDKYDENKQFSQIGNEIREYKVSEKSLDPLEETIAEIVNQNMCTELEITVDAETLSEADVSEILETKEKPKIAEKDLKYFAEHEKFSAELEKYKFSNFLRDYIETTNVSNKIYLMNCDTYEENILKEMASTFGNFEIVSFFPNGHLVPNKNIVKDVPLCTEISLPVDLNCKHKSPLFSPVKSECSFELSSDYDAKLDESVNKKSRQEVMEIILGGIIDESPSKMPTIDYYTEASDSENTLTIIEDICTESHMNENKIQTDEEVTESSSKRKADEDILNDSRSVLTPNKIRKISDSDHISSTTEETDVSSNNNKVQSATRSKYLNRARRVGLPRPKRCSLPNSPSSDKSVENYAQNTPSPPNGKLKTTRRKVQRYDTSDLYKPKLHFLSRRNNIR